jgi:hypothetical protein
MVVEHNESQSQTMALRPKLAGYSLRGPDPVEALCASGLLGSPWGAVSSMEGCLPASHRPRMAGRDSQRLEQSMASSRKRSAQKHGTLLNRGVRCAANLRSWRRGSWTTVIWTRNGGIGSNRGPVIVGSWHWTNCLGGYCGLSFGQAGISLGVPTNHGARSVGPWAYNVGATNSWGRSFILTE